jgi:FHS family L-fucose permease-like MFS transporter
MMILGGGVIPLLQGRICDIDLTNRRNICISWTHFSYVVPLTGFAYLGFMVLLSSNIKKQGVLQVESEGGGH